MRNNNIETLADLHNDIQKTKAEISAFTKATGLCEIMEVLYENTKKTKYRKNPIYRRISF